MLSKLLAAVRSFLLQPTTIHGLGVVSIGATALLQNGSSAVGAAVPLIVGGAVMAFLPEGSPVVDAAQKAASDVVTAATAKLPTAAVAAVALTEGEAVLTAALKPAA